MEKIIDILEYNTGTFPKAAVQEAIDRQEEITPLLLKSLEELLKDPAIALEDGYYMLHLYSVFLLAQFREEKAFPLIVGLVSLPASQVEELFNDAIIESLQDILFSTYNGDQRTLEKLVDDPNIYIWVRGAALKTLAKLYKIGKITEEYYLNLLRQSIKKQALMPEMQQNFHMLVQGIVTDFGIKAMLPDIKELYDQDLINLMVFGDYDEYLKWMEEDEEQVKYIEDTITEMEWWVCFDPEPYIFSTPLIKPTLVKVGRNEPCPCGSGKKYKKCCGR